MRTIYVEGSIHFREGLSWVKNIGAYFDEKWWKGQLEERLV